MASVIIDWNPGLPLVASQAFDAAGRSFRDGDPFPWRELGIDEQTAYNMWRATLVSHRDSAVEVFRVAPGETVTVTPARPKRPRSQRTE